MVDLPKPPPVPCGSCPYRRDVPSGVWAAEEYLKLPQYDGTTGDQLDHGAFGLFMCHQRDGCLCGGWLACHSRGHLLALRMHDVDPSAYDCQTDVPLWGSGTEAMWHGLRDIENPSTEARRKMAGLIKLMKDKEND